MTFSREPWTIKHHVDKSATVLDADGQPIGAFNDGSNAERFLELVLNHTKELEELQEINVAYETTDETQKAEIVELKDELARIKGKVNLALEELSQ